MTKIKVISWNIENIADSKLRRGPNSVLPQNSAQPSGAQQSKRKENATLDYIQTVITQSGADLVAIMEILGSKGTYMGLKLKKRLGPNWQFRESSPQRHTRKEQTLYLFKTATEGIEDLLELDASPSPAWTYGVVDNNSLSSFFSSLGNLDTSENRKKIFEDLVVSGYIVDEVSADKKAMDNIRKATAKKKQTGGEYFPPSDDGDDSDEEEYADDAEFKKTAAKNKEVDYGSVYISFRVNAAKWRDMQSEIPIALVSNQVGLSEAQITDLGDKLQQTDIVLFPSALERGPFLLQLNLKDSSGKNFPLVLAVLHAPSPIKKDEDAATDKLLKAGKRKRTSETQSDPKVKFEAINNLTMCIPLIDAQNMLLMGDFNVNMVESLVPLHELPTYARIEISNEFAFQRDGETTKLDDPFIPVTKLLEAQDLIGPYLSTSLKEPENVATGYMLNASWGASSADYTANPYDRFFLKTTQNFRSDNSGLLNLIDQMRPGAPEHNPLIAEAGMKFLRWTARLNFIDAAIKKLNQDAAYLGKYDPDADLATVAANISTSTSTPAAKRVKASTITGVTVGQRTMQINTQINALIDMKNVILQNTVNTPPDNFTSYTAYALFSDHLPIVTEIQFGTDAMQTV